VPVRRLISSNSVVARTGLPFHHEVVSLAPLIADAVRRVTGERR
jgi:ribose-phosphate pyrophosphokinase